MPLPGVVADGSGDLTVAAGEGRLRLDVVQPEGRRAMSGADFLRGRRLLVGTRLTGGGSAGT